MTAAHLEQRPCPRCGETHNVWDALARPDRQRNASDLERDPSTLTLRCPNSGERIYYRGGSPHWQWRTK